MATPLPKYGTTDLDDINLLENQQSNGESQQNSLTKLVTAFAVSAHVIARQDSPPGGVVESAVYMVGDTPTGGWSAFDTDDLAVGLDGGWHELDPFDGLQIHREDLGNARFVHDGTSWIEDPKSVTATITANTTQTQGQTPLTTRINHVSTVANANDVVTLQAAAAGIDVVVINAGANTLQVFPASGDDIDDGATNASTTVAAGAVARFFAADATSWYKLEA